MSSKNPFRICRIVLTIGCILCGISAAPYLAAHFTSRCNSVDQAAVAGIPNFEPPAIIPEAFEPVAVAFEAAEPEAVALKAAEPEAVAVEPGAVEPEPVAFDAVEPEGVVPEAAEPEALAFDAAEPEAVAFEPAEPETVAFDAVAFDAVAFDAAAFDAVAFDPVAPSAESPDAVKPKAAEPDAAESARSLSIEFSSEAFSIPESHDALGITALNGGQFLTNPVSDFFDPIAYIAPPVPVPVPVPVQLPAWPDVATLAVPSSQSAKRTTDPPFMNGRSQRVSSPPAQIANEPPGTEKIGALQPVSRMQPVSRTTRASVKHTTQSDCKKCTVAKPAEKPTYGIQAVSPTQAFRWIKSALSH